MTTKDFDLTQRGTLKSIECAAKLSIHEGMNPSWIRAFEDLAHAANVLDAFMARCSVPATVTTGGASGDAAEEAAA